MRRALPAFSISILLTAYCLPAWAAQEDEVPPFPSASAADANDSQAPDTADSQPADDTPQSPEPTPEPQRRAGGDKAKAGRLIVRGIALVRAGRVRTAIPVFEKACKEDPTSANAYFRLGDARFRLSFKNGLPENADREQARKALAAYQKALAIDPRLRSLKEPFLLYHGMAQCQEALGRYQDALKSVKTASVLAPANPMPHLYGAKLRQKISDQDKSSENLYYSVRRARKIHAYPLLAKLVRGDALFAGLLESPRNRAILDAYDAVHSGVLTEQEAVERLQGRAEYYDALAPSPRPSPIRPTVTAGDALTVARLDAADLAFRQQRYRDVIIELRALLDEDEPRGTLDRTQRSMVHERIGACFRNMALHAEAIRELRAALSEDSDNSAAYYQLALSYSARGDLTDSLAALNKSLSKARTATERRKTMLLARTDKELRPIRELERFQDILDNYAAD